MGVKKLLQVKGGNITVTFREAFEEFIDDRRLAGITEKTINNYEKSVQYFIEQELNDDDSIDIAELHKVYVSQWIETMQRANKKKTTINSYLRDLRAFLYWCMDAQERGYIEPAYKIELLKGQQPLPKAFTDDEVDLILQKPTNNKDFTEWRTWAIVNWVLATGNRAETVLNVTLGDINFTAGEISLRHTKNKKAQIIALPDSLAQILKLYIKKCRSGCSSDAWLFPSISDEKLTYNALAHSFSKYCKERGSAHTNIHGLRHYFSTAFRKAGGSGDALQRQLGHSTYAMTQRYIDLVDADTKQEIAELNPLSRRKSSAARTKKVRMN